MPRDQYSKSDATTDSIDRFRQLIDGQRSLRDALDRRAMMVAECAMLLLGAVLAALLAVSKLDAAASTKLDIFPRISLLAGVGCLVIATCTGLVTSATGLRTYGLHPDFIGAMADSSIRRPQFEELLLGGYVAAVRENHQSLRLQVRRLRWVLTALFAGLFYTSLAGVLAAADQSVSMPPLVTGVLALVTLMAAYRLLVGFGRPESS